LLKKHYFIIITVENGVLLNIFLGTMIQSFIKFIFALQFFSIA